MWSFSLFLKLDFLIELSSFCPACRVTSILSRKSFQKQLTATLGVLYYHPLLLLLLIEPWHILNLKGKFNEIRLDKSVWCKLSSYSCLTIMHIVIFLIFYIVNQYNVIITILFVNSICFPHLCFKIFISLQLNIFILPFQCML